MSPRSIALAATIFAALASGCISADADVEGRAPALPVPPLLHPVDASAERAQPAVLPEEQHTFTHPTHEATDAATASVRRAIEACGDSDGLSVYVTVGFGTDGRVFEVSIERRFANARFAPCVIRAARQARLGGPVPGGGYAITAPFILRSRRS